MNRSPSRRPLWFLVSLLLACGAATRAAELPKETWLGLYFNGRKIGYSAIRVEPADYRGKPALKITSDSLVRIQMLGNSVAQDIHSVTYTDATYRPLYQSYHMKSNGSATTLKADYQPGKILCTLVAGSKPTTRAVTVPPGADLAFDSSSVTQGKKVEIGQKTTIYYLNPLTIALDKSEVEVLAQEEVTLDKTAYTAFRVSTTSPFGKLVSWQTESGEVLKGDMPLGMAMYREPKARAMNTKSAAPEFIIAGATETKTAYTPPSDFAIATALQTDRPIKNPRTVRALSLKVGGLEDKALVLSDKRQQAAPVEGQPNTYRLDIRATDFDASKSVLLPITEPSVQKYLERAPYLETDDPQIKAVADEMRGKEKNAYRVAARIRDWVHKRMKPDYTIGVPRSCTDVYKRARGVCRDYATLYAGVARAAGIPTRVVGGIVYADGKFFYHAWAESWVGEWVAFDPTMGVDFVDATHIKFAQGDVTDMFNVGGIVGRLKLNVLQAQ